MAAILEKQKRLWLRLKASWLDRLKLFDTADTEKPFMPRMKG